MRIPCPGCGAEESRCREVLPACRKLAADQRRLYASANGSAVDESPALRSRVSELEAALRDVSEMYRSRTTPPWCTRCGADWTGEAHGHGCPAGRAVRLLEGSGAAPAEGLRGRAAREAGGR